MFVTQGEGLKESTGVFVLPARLERRRIMNQRCGVKQGFPSFSLLSPLGSYLPLLTRSDCVSPPPGCGCINLTLCSSPSLHVSLTPSVFNFLTTSVFSLSLRRRPSWARSIHESHCCLLHGTVEGRNPFNTKDFFFFTLFRIIHGCQSELLQTEMTGTNTWAGYHCWSPEIDSIKYRLRYFSCKNHLCMNENEILKELMYL